jgi:hypothetical protein
LRRCAWLLNGICSSPPPWSTNGKFPGGASVASNYRRTDTAHRAATRRSSIEREPDGERHWGRSTDRSATWKRAFRKARLSNQLRRDPRVPTRIPRTARAAPSEKAKESVRTPTPNI